MEGRYALKPRYTRRLDRFVRVAVGRGRSPDLFGLHRVVRRWR